MTRYTTAAVFLTILGLTQMAADLTGILPLKGLAAATNASPAPKVFSSVRGLVIRRASSSSGRDSRWN